MTERHDVLVKIGAGMLLVGAVTAFAFGMVEVAGSVF